MSSSYYWTSRKLFKCDTVCHQIVVHVFSFLNASVIWREVWWSLKRMVQSKWKFHRFKYSLARKKEALVIFSTIHRGAMEFNGTRVCVCGVGVDSYVKKYAKRMCMCDFLCGNGKALERFSTFIFICFLLLRLCSLKSLCATLFCLKNTRHLILYDASNYFKNTVRWV